MSDHLNPSRRDETTTGGKSNKRIRVTQACEPCRLKKGKCDGRQPTCTVCKRHKLKCSYDPNPRRRGLRPGQYSTLERRAWLAELIAAFLLHRTPGSEESLSSFFSIQDPNLPFIASAQSQAELEELFTSWKKSGVSHWLRKASARPDPTLDRISRLKLAQGSDQSPSCIAGGDEHNEDAGHGRDDGESRFVSTDKEDPIRPSTGPNPLPNHADDLFDTYFAYTHTWLPFLDKFKLTAFVRSYRLSSDAATHSAAELTSSQLANLALAWAVIAYASLHSNLPDKPESNPSPMDAAKQSLSLIPAFDVGMAQEHVQALIILALFFFEQGCHRSSWLLIGIAGRIVIDISTFTPGQHLSSSTRRTSLACFVVEGIIAASTNRTPQLPTLSPRDPDSGPIKGSPGDNVPQIEPEGWEEWSSWDLPGSALPAIGSSMQIRRESFQVLSTFNQTVLLVGILNQTIYPFDSQRSHDSVHTSREALLDGPPGLSAWAYHVSDTHPSLAPQRVGDAVLPHTINLHALYLLIRSILLLQHRNWGSEKSQYDEVSCDLASAVNQLAIRYQSAYPTSRIPLGLKAAMLTAMRLTIKDETVQQSLTAMLHQSRQDSIVSHGQPEPVVVQPVSGKLLLPMDSNDQGVVTQSDKRHQNVKKDTPTYALRYCPLIYRMIKTRTNVASEPLMQAPGLVDNRCYIRPTNEVTGLSDTAMNMGGTPDLAVVSMDVGDGSTVSPHDLTLLDAAVW